MVIAQIVEGFRQRGSWTKIQGIFKMCNLSTGRGWEETTKKLINEQDLNQDENFSKKVDQLFSYYNNFLLVSNKAVKLYSREREIINKWIVSFKSHEPEDNLFHEVYPFPLSKTRLNDLDESQKLVEIIDDDDKLVIIFCTKRFAIEKTEIDTHQLQEGARKELINYDKVIGEKRTYYQYFDIVVLSKKENFIEVRVDITTSSPFKYLSSKDTDKAFYQTISSFNKLLREIVKTKESLHTSTNVFPLIDRLYESDEGKVIELGFVTDGGSTKHEKMRKNSSCLRIEPYHDAGKRAIDHITPYRLAVSWDVENLDNFKNTLELSLPGNVKELSEVPADLGRFLIKNCICLEDYNFVLNKVLTYLKTS
ncbi:MAG: hypothetical protein RLZZ04_2829 [Cyanobacteriota bacterium]|jgi:hypothetical protein